METVNDKFEKPACQVSVSRNKKSRKLFCCISEVEKIGEMIRIIQMN